MDLVAPLDRVPGEGLDHRQRVAGVPPVAPQREASRVDLGLLSLDDLLEGFVGVGPDLHEEDVLAGFDDLAHSGVSRRSSR